MKALASGLLTCIQTCFNANNVTKLEYSSKGFEVEGGLSNDPFMRRYRKQHKDVSAWLCSSIEHVLWNMGAEIPLSTLGDDSDLSDIVYEAVSTRDEPPRTKNDCRAIQGDLPRRRWDPKPDVGYLNKQWNSLQLEKDKLESLTIQERSIKVRCPRYVYKVFVCTATIVLGGLVSDFLVGDRIPGVDPFNLAMYSWIIGGLMLLIAKVRHVSDWTWREFLLTEVACRSVSEVASLSKLDEQHILLHLLSKEPNSILRTADPYQGCFEKDSDGDGFSIDVKPQLETLVNAGIVPIKVLTLEGAAIVFLRLAYGSQGFKPVELAGKAPEVDVCFEPPTKDNRLRRVIVRKEVSWTSILGLYKTPGVVFG
ncbi:hypothetical protein CSAL01_09873 [Colletotrichum salicis]|uniref:Uncharacterized protein n=1 Tax=Colletotrichum salicis TaxID=1209931 RepID=A0A135ULL7_9PEZI|nr:hypothetical protein CSAL01_09873 [Colletotrichum salicis]